jgi:hypothetical protein
MINITFFGKKVGFVLAVAGAVVVGGATTAFVAAAIPSSGNGQIHGCYRNNSNVLDPKGGLRVIDSDASQICTAQESSLNWSATEGTQHSIAYAIVDTDGNLTTPYTSSEVLSVKREVLGGNPPYASYRYCFDLSFKPKYATYVTPNTYDLKAMFVSGGSGVDTEAVDTLCGANPAYDAVASGVGGEVTVPEKFMFSN